jgi:enamine deaminase RidA (YjgF/YER057c/UK114 family)
MATSTPEERLTALGLTLPAVPTPMANYMPYRLAGNLLFLSGQGPKRADGSFMVGRLGKDASVEQGYEAARLTGLQLLAVAKAASFRASRRWSSFSAWSTPSRISETIPRSSTVALTSWSRCSARRAAMRVRPLAWVRCQTA